jgi:hypothetical protein
MEETNKETKEEWVKIDIISAESEREQQKSGT